MSFTRTASLALATSLVANSFASAQTLFSDNFEVGSTATYTTVVDPAATTGSVFNPAYTYSNLGITGDVRSGRGALIETDRGITAFVNGLSITNATPVSIKYDLYLQPRSGGSTELATLGVGSNNQPFELFLRGSETNNALGLGVFATISTDSDTTGAGDYVLAEKGTTPSNPTRLFDGDAAGNTMSGTGFANIFPAGTAGPSGDAPQEAVAAFRWTTVELILNGSTVTYKLNGVEVATATATVSTTGSVGIGLVDPFPGANNSAALGDGSGTIAIVDNLVVSVAVVPEPTTLAAAAGLGGLAMLRRRRA